MKLILLSSTNKCKYSSLNLSAMVDDDDFDELIKYGWSVSKKENGLFYAVANIGGEMVAMHRMIMGCIRYDGKIVDHKDRNGLNCQRDNLRLCTAQESVQNRAGWGSSKYLGVHLKKDIKTHTTKKCVTKIYRSYTWQARIKYKGKQISLGLYKTDVEAALTYNEAAKKYFGEFACLNIIIDAPVVASEVLAQELSLP